MNEVAAVAGDVTGMRAFAYPADTITPPAAVVAYPAGQGIEYNQTYRNALTRIPDLELHLIGSRVTDRSARDQASAWLNEDDPESMISVLRSHAWESCDEVTVISAEFQGASEAGALYLDVTLHLDIMGPGVT